MCNRDFIGDEWLGGAGNDFYEDRMSGYYGCGGWDWRDREMERLRARNCECYWRGVRQGRCQGGWWWR